MLCQQCQQREATVHIVQVSGEQMVKLNYCEECGKVPPSKTPPGSVAGWTSHSPSAAFVGRLSKLVEVLGTNPRFPIEAYNLVCEAIDEAHRHALHRGPHSRIPSQHVTGAQVLLAFRDLVLKRFGKQARAKLAVWEIHRTEDVGGIVFELIGKGLLGKTDKDKIEDFADGYDFREAFPED